MSTRANIKIIEGNKVTWLYHHQDGYPTYLGAFLMWRLYNKLNNKNYYLDTSDIVNRLIKDKVDNAFEYTSDMHGDIKYLYIIDVDKRTIKCFEMDFIADPNDKFSYDLKVGNEVDLRTSISEYNPARTTLDNKEVWYLCDNMGNCYQNKDHCTAYFDSKEQAQDQAFKQVFEMFDIKYKNKGEC